MLSQKIQDAFNKQVNMEAYSAYLYLSMFAHFEAGNLRGMAHWMQMQVEEELLHTKKFLNFINDRGGKVVLAQIDAPKTEWKSPVAIFEDAYKHECLISSAINDLVELSLNEKDHATNAFLQWFVTEQVEEESTVHEIVERLKLVDGNTAAMLLMDHELGQRASSPASAASVG